ncbi:unnamed protein product [Mytilus coruscus]|uniref:TIR domain-containing protein n=1 Tax=Mytilus coruscus TaxID=42192 RepID=A0A6J8CTZ2_MYTCO|nr:unnamed protein product [Mytilus coruscus]
MMVFFFCLKRYKCHICEIHDLSVNCTYKELRNVPNDLPEGIVILDLRFNVIHRINGDVFGKYRNLKSLHLDYNKISLLPTNAFDGLEHLQGLFLTNNNLDFSVSYEVDVFSPLKRLQQLDIRHNMKKKYTSKVQYPLFENLHNLRKLSLDLIDDPVFDNCGFEKLQNITKIVFENCDLRMILNNTFSMLPNNLEEIHLRKCNMIRGVEADAFRSLRNLKILIIHHSNMKLESALKLLYPFENKHMRVIQFTRVNPGYKCPIETPYAVILTRQMMQHLQKICFNTLVLTENGIVDFEHNSLLWNQYPECIQNIELSGNRFSLMNGFKLTELWNISRKLINLTSFDMSYNPLSYRNVEQNIKNLPDNKLSNFNSIFLKNTEIGKPPCSNISFLSRNRNYATPTRESPIETVFVSLPQNLKQIRNRYYLANERLGKRIVLLNASNLTYLDMAYFDVGNLPEIVLKGQNNIKYIDFSGIPSWNTSMSLFAHSKTVLLRYNGIWSNVQQTQHYFSFIQEVEELDISGNQLWQLRYDTFLYNKKLRKLIMQNNLFDELPTALIPIENLNFLDFSGNILDSINETMRNWLDKQQKKNGTFKIFLRYNIFKCTCETKDFIRWIFETSIEFDEPNKEYKCMLSNGSITTTVKVYQNFHDYFSICNNEIWLRVGIGLLVSFITVTVPLAIIINFKWQITYWFYRKFRKAVEIELKKKFVYDIYLSYSNQSLYWVKNILMPKIENCWRMKMCLEDRDISVGDAYVDAICDSIQQSRNIIFIITKDFSEKHWGRFEIERAKYEKYASNLQKIIVITRQVPVENFPTEFEHILNDVILINWSEAGNENDWENLRRALVTDIL